MTCVILAAGRGTRLQPLTNRLPKCLIPLGEEPILFRTLEKVFDRGIRNTVIVTGHCASAVEGSVEKWFGSSVCTFVNNDRYASTNNAYSLLCARSVVEQWDEPLLLIDSDIVFHREILVRLHTDGGDNKVAVREDGLHDGEEMRVRVGRNRKILSIGKDLPRDSSGGEAVGINIFSPPTVGKLFSALDDRMRRHQGENEFYEAAFQQLIDDGVALYAVNIDPLPVAEIDTHADLAYVTSTVLHHLK